MGQVWPTGAGMDALSRFAPFYAAIELRGSRTMMVCEFRFNPATHTDLISAAVPI